MKTKTKIGATILFLAFLLLFIAPSAFAGTCSHNPWSGYYAHTQMKVRQHSFLPLANDLEFTAYVDEWLGNKPSISGYRISVDCFPTVNCWWGDGGPKHYEVDARAEDDNVLYDEYCVIDVTLWTRGELKCTNQIKLKDVTWTYELEARVVLPDHGWCVVGSDVTIFNDDDTDDFKISGFEYFVSEDWFHDIRDVLFDGSIPGQFSLSPDETKEFTLPYIALKKGHVYFHYEMLNATNDEPLAEVWGDHGFGVRVGGFAFSVDKFGLLAPYVGVASTIVAGTVAAAIYIRRRKKHQ
jgi:hypothetical protein